MPLRINQPSPRTVIHLGAGRSDRQPEFRDSGAEQILLLEPDSQQAARLKCRWGDQPGISILAAAAGERDEIGELRIMSLPALNSLAAPAPALTALYPGLRQERRQEVQILSPESVMRGIDTELRPLWLVIDTAGQELVVLKAWKAAGMLAKVDLLEVRCGEEPFYSGSAGRSEIEAWLEAEGFTMTERNLDDPDWPVLQFQIDHTARTLAQAKARIVALEGAVAAHAAELDGARNRILESNAALAEAKAATEAKAAALAAALAETEAKAAALAETEGKLGAATERSAALDRALAEAKAATGAKAAALAETEGKLGAATERSAALDRALAEAKAATEAKAAALAATEGKLGAATERSAALDRALAENERLKNREQDQEHRLIVARTDLRRAEGQMALIKDLLLRKEIL